MSFYELSQLLPDMISPLPVAMFCFFVALLARRRRAVHIISNVSGLLILLIFSSPWTVLWLIGTLEGRYPAMPLSELPQSDVAIVLGGSVNVPAKGLVRAELGPSGDRILLTAEVYLAGKADKILISAGSYDPIESTPSEAAHTSRILQLLGVPEADIIIEDASGNTYENALESTKLLGELLPRNYSAILITSSLHMTRARALFCAAGMETVAIGANRWLNPTSEINIGNWFFRAISLAGSTRVLREYLGIAVYGMTGRLDLSVLSHDKPCTNATN